MSDPLTTLDARVASARLPSLPVLPASHRFLGYEIGFPIGIASSAGTRTPDHVEYFARHGFNVLTYKTVRSCAWPAHPEPNWVYLENLRTPLTPESLCDPVVACGDSSTRIDDAATGFSTANSFGVPSPDPSVWQDEFSEAMRRLGPHQLLIASVQGSSEIYCTLESLVGDCVRVALLAEDAGAKAIEVNLSCPNTFEAGRVGMARPICETPSVVHAIIDSVRGHLAEDTRLIAKLSFLSAQQLTDVVGPIARTVDAISGINTVPVAVFDRLGQPTFRSRSGSEVRDVAGLSGVALRLLARDFLTRLVAIRAELASYYDILAMGGVMVEADVQALLRLGANAVQSVSAAVRDPSLAGAATRSALADQVCR